MNKELIRTIGLFFVTAIAEIVGCYLPYLWLQKGKSAWLIVPAAFSLAVFSWLLTLHPAASGRIYAAYGGIYVTTAIGWLCAVDGIRPTTADIVGAFLCLIGMGIIVMSDK
jgi:small multidrug resistance family-3 protein